MLAGLLAPLGHDVLMKTGRLNQLSDDELLTLHRRYKGLIKWITKKNKVSEILSQDLIDKIEKEDVLLLRNLLGVEDEEAMLLILIAANL